MSKAGTGLRSEDFVRLAEGGVYVKLRVSPGAKSTAVKGLYGDSAIRLSVAASPVEGKANAEVERYLTQLLSFLVRKSQWSRARPARTSSCS